MEIQEQKKQENIIIDLDDMSGSLKLLDKQVQEKLKELISGQLEDDITKLSNQFNSPEMCELLLYAKKGMIANKLIKDKFYKRIVDGSGNQIFKNANEVAWKLFNMKLRSLQNYRAVSSVVLNSEFITMYNEAKNASSYAYDLPNLANVLPIDILFAYNETPVNNNNCSRDFHRIMHELVKLLISKSNLSSNNHIESSDPDEVKTYKQKRRKKAKQEKILQSIKSFENGLNIRISKSFSEIHFTGINNALAIGNQDYYVNREKCELFIEKLKKEAVKLVSEFTGNKLQPTIKPDVNIVNIDDINKNIQAS